MKIIIAQLLSDEHFDLRVYFSDIFEKNNGFDIVIGNPPYFKYEGEHKDEIQTIKQQAFSEYCGGGKINAYRAFIAMSLHRLTKPQGILCMIFQNSFLGDSSAAALRKYVLGSHNLIQIDSFPERDNIAKRVFYNVKMSVCILLCQALTKTNSFVVNVYNDRYFDKKFSNVLTVKDVQTLDPKNWTIPMMTPVEMPIIKKILQKSPTMEIKTIEGEINMTFHKHLLSDQEETGPEVLKGAGIQRYYITKKMSQGKREFLDVRQYEKENSGKKTQHHKYDRVAMQGMTGVDDKRRIIMTYVPKGFYLANSCNYIILPTQEQAFFALGILNSKLINWLFKKNSTNSNVNCYEVDALPIPAMQADKSTEEIIRLVREVLVDKNNGVNTDVQESQIDNIVYELYGLSSEEISEIEQLYKPRMKAIS